MAESKELTPFKPVMPLATPEEVEKAWATFEAMKSRLLVDDDYQTIAGKRYIKRSGFRKIAVFFGLSDKILEQERVDREDDSFTWRIVVQATAPNGRTSIGVGICDSRERKFAHVEHDVYATAHTRAKSRAISDMVAGGAVSAEEMEASPEERPSRTVKENPRQEKAVPPPAKGLRLGKVNLDIIAYNLKALGFGEDDVSVFEEEDGYTVEPLRDLSEAEQYKISGTLESMGATWEEVGYRGRWRFSRKEETHAESQDSR
jgi:hypothetical protein